MGFSVSGSYAVIFFGVMFAMGSLHASSSNAVEDVGDAQQYQNDHLASVQSTGIEVADVTVVDSLACDVTLAVNNTGETTLVVGDTDVLVDGVYVEDIADASSVDGDANTGLWRPGEQLKIGVDGLPAAPDRVSVVSGPGVADAVEVSGLTC